MLRVSRQPSASTFRHVASAIQRLSRYLFYLGCGATVVMGLLTVVDVTLRYVANHPIMGTVELVSYLLCLAFFSTIAWTEVEGRHIVIEFLFDRFPAKIRLPVRAFVDCLSLVTVGLMTWGSFVYASGQESVSGVLHIPILPFVYFAAFCWLLYALAILVNLTKSLQKENR